MLRNLLGKVRRNSAPAAAVAVAAPAAAAVAAQPEKKKYTCNILVVGRDKERFLKAVPEIKESELSQALTLNALMGTGLLKISCRDEALLPIEFILRFENFLERRLSGPIVNHDRLGVNFVLICPEFAKEAEFLASRFTHHKAINAFDYPGERLLAQLKTTYWNTLSPAEQDEMMEQNEIHLKRYTEAKHAQEVQAKLEEDKQKAREEAERISGATTQAQRAQALAEAARYIAETPDAAPMPAASAPVTHATAYALDLAANRRNERFFDEDDNVDAAPAIAVAAPAVAAAPAPVLPAVAVAAAPAPIAAALAVAAAPRQSTGSALFSAMRLVFADAPAHAAPSDADVVRYRR